MIKLKQYLSYRMALAALLGLFLCFTVPVRGQEAGDLLAWSQSVNPDSLIIGDEAVITLQLQGGSLESCFEQRTPADIVLAIDLSTSMDEEQRLESARQAVTQFINDVDLTVDQVAIVVFSSEATLLQPLTQNKTLLQNAVSQLDTVGATNIQAGLQMAGQALLNHRADSEEYIVLLSDGRDSALDDIVAEAELLHGQAIRIFTITLGQDADQVLMQQIASAPEDHYHAPQSADLHPIYDAIGGQIAEAVATNVVITTTVATDNFQYNDNSLSPTGVVTGDQIIWTVPSIGEGETATFTIQVRAVTMGTVPTTVNTEISFLACGETPSILNPMPGDNLTVMPLPPTVTPFPTIVPTPLPQPPCDINPIGNECITTTPCLGPVTLPCATLGLPWWVCLLVLLLLALALLYSWRWRRQTKPKQPLVVSEIAPPDLPEFLPLMPFTAPVHLTVKPPPAIPTPAPTLIIGLGSMGQGVVDEVINSIAERQAEIPDLLRLLHISVANMPNAQHDVHHITLPLNQDVHNLLAQVTENPDRWSHLSSWLLPLDGSKDDVNRSLHRLTLFVNRDEVQKRIAKELRQMQLGAGQRVEIYFVSAMAEPTGSGLLVDVAHLARKEAQKSDLKAAVYTVLAVPETHLTGINFDDQDVQRQTAFAHWRELNRFQLTFAHEYPIDYGTEHTVRNGRLFERCYLIGPERDRGLPLVNTPLTEGLYPAVADFLLALLDPAIRRDWEELHRATDSRLLEKQVERQRVLYNSLGSFTYILPTGDIVQRASLKLLDELIAAQQVTPDFDPGEMVSHSLEKSGDGTIPNTILMKALAQLSRVQPDRVSETVDEWALNLGDMYAPDETAHANWEKLEDIVYGRLVRAIPTGMESGETNEGIYHDVFLNLIRLAQFGHVIETLDAIEGIAYWLTHKDWQKAKINQFDPWLEKCQEVQFAVFVRRVEEQLRQLLGFKSEKPGSTGSNAARVFLDKLSDTLEVVKSGVEQVGQQRQITLKEFDQQIEDLEKRMAAARDAGQHRKLNLPRALAIGFGVPLLIVLVMGVAFLVNPALSVSLALIPVGFVLVGAYWTYRSLFVASKLARLQAEYRELVQKGVQMLAQAKLYESLKELLENMHSTTSKARTSLEEWQTSLKAVKTSLLDERENLEQEQISRQKIHTRRYFEDARVFQELWQRYIPANAVQDACERIYWEKKPDGSLKPIVYGSFTGTPTPANATEVALVLRDLTDSFASAIHGAQLAEILPDFETAVALAGEVEKVSEPFIRTESALQPDQENHRFFCIQAGIQANYFHDAIKALREPATMHYTQQGILQTSHPHFGYALSSLDLLGVEGLYSWMAARDATQNLQQATRHIFPAEVNAVQWEAAARRHGLAIKPFSPYAVLTLENGLRSYTFWVAYALHWLREDEDLSQRTRQRAWVLTIPQISPLRLTDPKPESPSLWQAAVRYGLLKEDASIQAVWREVGAQRANEQEARRSFLRMLERRYDEIKSQGNQISPTDPPLVVMELGQMACVVLADLIQWLDGEQPLLPGLKRPEITNK